MAACELGGWGYRCIRRREYQVGYDRNGTAYVEVSPRSRHCQSNELPVSAIGAIVHSTFSKSDRQCGHRKPLFHFSIHNALGR